MDLSGTIMMSLFAYGMMIVIAGLSAVLIRMIVAVLARAGDARKRATAAATSVSVSVAPARDETAAQVAAVAAAVYAVIGAHRLVHIGEATRGSVWATLGRSQHQTSHAPRLDHH
ncbi:MAG: hypothetical protein JNM75_13020 [Rhodospirillales bacterium]|nr:hypothetical protein [Rhodospirillales bacterium]